MRYHKTQVRLRCFQKGDLVLQKVSIAMHVPGDGKLGPNWEGPYRVTRIARKGTYCLKSMDEKALP